MQIQKSFLQYFITSLVSLPFATEDYFERHEGNLDIYDLNMPYARKEMEDNKADSLLLRTAFEHMILNEAFDFFDYMDEPFADGYERTMMKYLYAGIWPDAKLPDRAPDIEIV